VSRVRKIAPQESRKIISQITPRRGLEFFDNKPPARQRSEKVRDESKKWLRNEGS
jgi:hypothetical protein